MAIPEQYKSIIDGLLAASQQGRVNWQESAREGEFFVGFRQFSLTIRFVSSEQEADYVWVRLLDASGKIIDSFTAEDREPDYRKLNNLSDLARRKARRIDEALSHIAEELNTEKGIGDEPPPF